MKLNIKLLAVMIASVLVMGIAIAEISKPLPTTDVTISLQNLSKITKVDSKEIETLLNKVGVGDMECIKDYCKVYLMKDGKRIYDLPAKWITIANSTDQKKNDELTLSRRDAAVNTLLTTYIILSNTPEEKSGNNIGGDGDVVLR